MRRLLAALIGTCMLFPFSPGVTFAQGNKAEAPKAVLNATGEPALTIQNTELFLRNSSVTADENDSAADAAEGLSRSPGNIVADELTSSILYGDANSDGVVNIADAIAVCRFVALTETYTPAELVLADVDGDGILSVADVVHLCKYILGIEKKLPRQTEEESWGAIVP